jgi:hypothetical protein
LERNHEQGDDPTIPSVDDLFPAISKAYKGDDEQREYLLRLGRLAEKLSTQGKRP